ncbi:MAG: peptidylprolyl isomerase [Terriglobales bacterium]
MSATHHHWQLLVAGLHWSVVSAARLHRPRAAAALLLMLALVGAGCSWLRPAPPGPDVLATVNGQPIHADELNRLYAQQTAGASAPLPPQQSLQLRLTLLSQLIDRHILLQYAARLGIQPDPAKLQQELSVATVHDAEAARAAERQQIGGSLILNQLLQLEVGDKIHIRQADIAAFYQQNEASFHLPERQYHVLEIVVTPHPGAVTNLAQDKATTSVAAQKKIAMLERRLAAHADFATLAEQYSEDAATASSGGDLGLIPASVLNTQTPPLLRDAILRLRRGEVSPVVSTPNGYYLIKLAGIEPAGLRPLSDPQVQQSIRDLLTSARQQVLQAAFLTTVRNQARVTNYYAQRILADAN